MQTERAEWSLGLLRALWPLLSVGMTRRSRSLQHETAWLSLAGYALRPGYGCSGDSERIAEAWRVFELGIAHSREARAWVQWWIFWRRIAAGLNSEQQTQLFEQAEKQLKKKGFEVRETYRLLGSLSLVDLERRIALGSQLVAEFKSGKVYPETTWAFGRLCSRHPMGVQQFEPIPVSVLETWFAELDETSWEREKYRPLAEAWRLAGRIHRDDSLNLSETVREQIYHAAASAGIDSSSLQVLREYVPLAGQDTLALLGDSLPLGLSILEDEVDDQAFS